MGETISKTLLTALLVAVALGIGVGAGMSRRAPTTTEPASVQRVVEERAMIEVHVAGWVVSSGVVSVRAGSIVAEAIEAAGGLRHGAMTESINLAAEVLAGDQIVVPGPPTEAEARGSGTIGAEDGLLSLNRAGVTELEELPGVGPVLADRIVGFREENGRFESVDDLLEVPGIGEAKLANIRDLVRP